MRILIIDEVHLLLVNELEKKGHQVNYHPDYTYQQTLECIQNYNGLIVRSKFFIDKALIEKGNQLNFLARAGVGLDIFDLKYAESRGIQILNAAGANANSVAEHLVGMLFSLFHNINRASRQVKNFEWNREENRGEELIGKTIGIIGYGNVGQAVAKKLKAFDCKVIAFDKYKSNFSDDYAKEVGMDEIFNQSDILSLHIPLTDETKYLCDDDFFNRFKKKIYFLNTARGKIVKTSILIDRLNNEDIKGTCLDVLENEDLTALNEELNKQYIDLFNRDNVLLSPHVAGWSNQSFENISLILVKKILGITN